MTSMTVGVRENDVAKTTVLPLPFFLSFDDVSSTRRRGRKRRDGGGRRRVVVAHGGVVRSHKKRTNMDYSEKNVVEASEGTTTTKRFEFRRRATATACSASSASLVLTFLAVVFGERFCLWTTGTSILSRSVTAVLAAAMIYFDDQRRVVAFVLWSTNAVAFASMLVATTPPLPEGGSNVFGVFALGAQAFAVVVSSFVLL